MASATADGMAIGRIEPRRTPSSGFVGGILSATGSECDIDHKLTGTGRVERRRVADAERVGIFGARRRRRRRTRRTRNDAAAAAAASDAVVRVADGRRRHRSDQTAGRRRGQNSKKKNKKKQKTNGAIGVAS